MSHVDPSLAAYPRLSHFPKACSLLVLVTLIAACTEPPAPESPPPPTADQRPNVIVVLLDTLRPDHLPLYGYEEDIAPFLQELGEQSVVFQHAYSTSSWTAPSTASVFTGLYPVRHGVVEGFRTHEQRVEKEGETGSNVSLKLHKLPSEIASLPVLFKEAGYKTFGVAANINIDERMGFSQGFDHFESSTRADAEEVARLLFQWERKLRRAKPFFVYLHFNDAHYPYNAQKPWYKHKKDKLKARQGRYDSEISFLDAHLKRIFNRLSWPGSAICVVVSDHGEEFMEHDGFKHKFSLHNELNRVVMFARIPGIQPQTIQENVSLIDVFPSLLELTGLQDPDPRDGQSFWPLLQEAAGDPTPFQTRTLFAHRQESDPVDRQIWAAISGSWKYIEPDPSEGEPMLFELTRDRLEQTNVITQNAQQSTRIKGELDAFREQTGGFVGEEVQIELDQSMLDELRELGYVDGGEEEDGP